MGRYKYCNATIGGIIYQLPELLACSRIYTSGRFVEEDNVRLMEYGNREGEFLLPSKRQRANQVVTVLCKMQPFQKNFCLVRDIIVTHTIYSTKQPEILSHREVFIKRELLAHVANVFLYLLILRADVVPRHLSTATRRLV